LFLSWQVFIGKEATMKPDCWRTTKREPQLGIRRDCPGRGSVLRGPVYWLGWTLLITAAAWNTAHGQVSHRLHTSHLPPGVVGQQQAYRIPQGFGYKQPVELRGTGGAQVAIQIDGEFSPAAHRVAARLQVGGVFPYRVTEIPGHPGIELYPTIEVIHRLYPPEGLADQFPVIVELNQDDLETAASGSYVVKVIYLEDPAVSQWQAHDGETQPFFDLAPGAELLHSADLMGRPIAILRLGSRLPNPGELHPLGFPAAPELLAADPQRGQAREVVQWNPLLAELDSSYRPQMRAPHEGHSQLWNMEHVFDGGDRGAKARVGLGDDWEVSGLETEDTIGHFDTLDGQRMVVPSNRVAIYSPRFAAVRQRLNVLVNSHEMPAMTAEQRLVHMLQGSRAQAGTTAQFEQVRQTRDAESLQSVRQRMAPVWSTGQVLVVNTTGTTGADEISHLLAQATLTGSQKAMLAKGRVAALSWGGVDTVQVLADFQAADVVLNVTSAVEVLESHSPFQRPRLRLIKLASREAAQAGEEVEFTLKFENVGDQVIGNVTLMDNLPDRLEYVPGTASCDLKCEFYTSENGRGSHILRWDIEPPLKVNQGGTIRFTCRVR